MRLIDRILTYLDHHRLSPYQFEKSCGIANGYLKKQSRGRGTVGSEILEKILSRYSDLSLTWLVTGEGTMLVNGYTDGGTMPPTMQEQQRSYASSEQVVKLLHDKIKVLEAALADKEKIIRLLEQQLAAAPR